MTMIPSAAFAAAALLIPGTVTAPMTSDHVAPASDHPRALTLDVQEQDGTIEVQLIGLSALTQQVSYTLEVNGRSTSRHSGSTTLTAGTAAVLSTMRASAGESWCVKLAAQEPGREPYEITHGSCNHGAA